MTKPLNKREREELRRRVERGDMPVDVNDLLDSYERALGLLRICDDELADIPLTQIETFLREADDD